MSVRRSLAMALDAIAVPGKTIERRITAGDIV